MRGSDRGGRGGHAVVVGAGIAGLLAARVLSERFARVSVIDRDGSPRGNDAHGLLARGREILDELFPGLTGELVSLGAVSCDVQEDWAWYHEGRRLHPASSGLRGLAVSRPLLESAVRARVAELPNVGFRDRCEVVGLLPGGPGVRGVRLMPDEVVTADLVVDASGRGERAVGWLRELGYRPPEEERVDAGPVQVTREYRSRPDDADADAILVARSAAVPRGGFAVRAEGDRWLITVLGMGDDAPSADPDGYERFAARLPVPDIHRLMRKLEPLGPPRLTRAPAGVRRRYERLRRFPDGYVVLGDALCRFHPSYGQDMTVAACQAVALREALRTGTDGVARRFFPAAARIVDVPWHVTGRSRLLDAYLGRVRMAAETDPVVGKALLKVTNLVAPPQSLFAPHVLARVLRRPPGEALVVRYPSPVQVEDVLPSLMWQAS